MSNDRPYVVVIGASNIDIGGISARPLVAEDSNPGMVKISCGGVGHNIAMNLARLGADVRFITALGDDAIGGLLHQEMDGLLDYSHSARPEGGRSSTYLYIADSDGNMKLAINDMGIIDSITPERIMESQALINGAELVVIEANLNAETIGRLCSVCHRPIIADTVSTIKGPRLGAFLGSLELLKPNLMELEALSGVGVGDEDSLLKACEALFAQGLRRLLVSLGRHGAMYCDRSMHFMCSPLAGIPVVSTNGAGDSLMAGFAFGLLGRKDMETCLRYAIAAAQFNTSSLETVCGDIDWRRLTGAAEELRINEQISGLFS